MDEIDYIWFNEELVFDDEIYDSVCEESEIMENKKLFIIELSQRENKVSMYQWSNEQGIDIVEYPYEFTSKLYEALEEDHDMSEHLNKPLCDSYEMPLCETIRTDNFEVLSNMSHMITQMLKMMQEIFEALPPKKEDMFDVHKLDHENPGTIDNHDGITMRFNLSLSLKIIGIS
ncbi:hypothetical protein PVK06_027574 [Gossypium arboreum]|uniref:Uncharacterized protein n=1 Tax=Gossypium arboreum TaxID=29729 RepID=A0ABR0P0N0_GOSAR|nr:hypothetical protein PVK06_027574 [Gossypium arboreum]